MDLFQPLESHRGPIHHPTNYETRPILETIWQFESPTAEKKPIKFIEYKCILIDEISVQSIVSRQYWERPILRDQHDIKTHLHKTNKQT